MSEDLTCPKCGGSQRFEGEAICRSCSHKAFRRQTCGIIAICIGVMLMIGGLLFFATSLLGPEMPLALKIFPWVQVGIGLATVLFGFYLYRRN